MDGWMDEWTDVVHNGKVLRINSVCWIKSKLRIEYQTKVSPKLGYVGCNLITESPADHGFGFYPDDVVGSYWKITFRILTESDVHFYTVTVSLAAFWRQAAMGCLTVTLGKHWYVLSERWQGMTKGLEVEMI